MRLGSSDITITDQFCGAGGSSLGASRVEGVRVRMALNHWKLAIETHNTNFPDADHDCTDISACDPRRYPRTNILITSPECTNHSLANGKKKGISQGDLFVPAPEDPSAERSRATMWDVPRFAEYHGYDYIVVENVPDATKWVMFGAWLHAMHSLGYKHRVLSLNSMFFYPCPQSRDRMYVVFWKAGNRAPSLDHTPRARCARCETDVHALQTWKLNRRTGKSHRVGKYDSNGKQNQYFYSCPACRQRVEPYFFCALNAIDFTIPAERIGDRSIPLKPRTMDRIRYGLEKFGNQYLVVRANMTSGVGCRVRSAEESALDTFPGSNITALVSPRMVETQFSHAPDDRSTGGDEALPAQTTRASKAVVLPHAVPQLIHTRQGSGLECRVSATDRPMGTQTANYDRAVVLPEASLHSAGGRVVDPAGVSGPSPTFTGSDRLGLTIPPGAVVSNMENNLARGFDEASHSICTGGKMGVVLPPAFVSTQRQNNLGSEMTDPLDAFCATGGHHALVVNGAALVTLRDRKIPNQLVRGLDEAMGVQVAAATQDWLISSTRFIASYYGQQQATGITGGLPVVTTLERHTLVDAPTPDINDSYFRMLQPPEIQAGMSFDPDYVVLGNKRDKVKQLGNAVTPPVMQWIVGRCVAALDRGGAP